MIIDLFNPIKGVSKLKRHGKAHFLILMLSPFFEPIVYGHFSIILGAIGLWAFFNIAACVVSEPEDTEDPY